MSDRRTLIPCETVARMILIGLALAPWSVRADDAPDLLESSIHAALGSFILSTDTILRLDGEAGQEGSKVDWEENFGDDDLNQFRLDGFWRFAERHKVRVLWFSASRDTSRSIEEDIEWGDNVYPTQVQVDAHMEFSVYELAYEYAFLRRENYEVSGTFGVHYTKLAASLAAEGVISGGEPVEGRVSREGDFGAPLPVIGARGLWRLPRNFWIDASAQIFAISVDEFDGDIQDFRFVLAWQPKTWLGIGLGYNQFAVDIDVDKDRFRGKVDWTYRGPMLFYSASF